MLEFQGICLGMGRRMNNHKASRRNHKTSQNFHDPKDSTCTKKEKKFCKVCVWVEQISRTFMSA